MNGGGAALPRATELLDAGMLALPEAAIAVSPAHDPVWGRTLVVRCYGGLSVEILLDRGLDVGRAWWGAVPLSWRSMHLADPGPGAAWEQRFLGGLVTTCGPDNIGPARDGLGMHGTHHGTPAYEVSWERVRSGDDLGLVVRGSVGSSTLYGRRIVVDRTIRVPCDRAYVEITDVVRNDGADDQPVPLLYHVNLGAPLLSPGARLEVAVDDVVVREDAGPGDPLTLPDAPRRGPGAAEAVVAEHVRPGPDATGAARARLVTPSAAAQVVVDWDVATLPRLFTWNWPGAGSWVLGVEPSNAPLFGPDREQPSAGGPLLEPGGRLVTRVGVGVEPTRG